MAFEPIDKAGPEAAGTGQPFMVKYGQECSVLHESVQLRFS